LDTRGESVQHTDSVVFAVTSANHEGTKRNPIPFHLRALIIQDFARDIIPVPTYIYGIDDVGHLEDFASYTLKSIRHQGSLELTPVNTTILCSTDVRNMYSKLGFRIVTAELDLETSEFIADLPWHFVEKIAASEHWAKDREIVDGIHTSTFRVWQTYQLGQTVHRILNDPIIGVDGDLTETRDYSSYVRRMDEIAALKFKETAPYIRSGSIGDIGCSVGSWIKQGGAIHTESDFYGIELARNLFDICLQRKHNGEFTNSNTFFSMKNAVSDLVFRPDSMTTIHTGSITHEIFSYGSREDLLKFIGNRFRELQPGGVWINRDVIGPEKGEQQVLLHLSTTDGVNDVDEVMALEEDQIAEKLHSFSTYSRFLRFANDFLFETPFGTVETKDSEMNAIIQLSLRDAAEFLLTKDYTDNWNSEMQERFCFWS